MDNKPHVTAEDFFLWAGAMVAFYWSVLAFIFLIFNYIDYTFPNALAYYPANPYDSGISYQMASIIVLFPAYVFLMRLIRGDIMRDPSRKEIWVRRWALILTLFVAGIAIAIDLITLLTTFLNGEELTTAFLLKVLVVLLVAAAAFMHFISDLRGYWDAFPGRRNMVGYGIGVLALLSVVAGFFIVGTPQDARLARFDTQKVNDLQTIQSQVIYYWQAKRALPRTMSDLNNSLSYGSIPVDPQTGAEYSYRPTAALAFELCATFNKEGGGNQGPYFESRAMMPVGMGGKGMTLDNWQHGEGEVCFERTIDPAFYPPLTTQ